MHVMIQARSHAISQNTVGTFAQGKNLAEQLPCSTGSRRGSERAEIDRTVTNGLAGDGKPGIFRLLVQPEQDILLVILQHHIVPGPVFLDQA